MFFISIEELIPIQKFGIGNRYLIALHIIIRIIAMAMPYQAVEYLIRQRMS